jgi:hypothetical protein
MRKSIYPDCREEKLQWRLRGRVWGTQDEERKDFEAPFWIFRDHESKIDERNIIAKLSEYILPFCHFL